MWIFSNLKYKYGLYQLKKESRYSSKKTIVCNLSEAKSVGIIFNATNHNNINIIKNFVKELKKDIPEIDALGFVDKKELDDFYIQTQAHDISFFSHKDLNWYYKPVSDNVTGFIKKPFDILIDLNMDDLLTVKFIIVESKSKFKVGKFNDSEYDYYDLTLNIESKTDSYLSYFIDQVKVYLNMIKTK